jgi:hypothetical protein
VAGEARNSIEKMLLYQLATAHVHAMKCFEMSMGFNLPGNGLPTVEQVRLLNAAARLMDVFQNGVLVHHKIRHGATQTVIVKQQVQQVQVNDGGRGGHDEAGLAETSEGKWSRGSESLRSTARIPI